jgi:hypothetical protein
MITAPREEKIDMVGMSLGSILSTFTNRFFTEEVGYKLRQGEEQDIEKG